MSIFNKITAFTKWTPNFLKSTPTFQTRLFAKTSDQERKKIVLKNEELIETFVKGSGPGGQCVNKRSSCVDLRHIPTGLRVQCQQTRSLAENRGIARKLLREKLDELENGSLSKAAKKTAKIVKRKAQRAKRARSKYGVKPDTDGNDDQQVNLSEAPAGSSPTV